MFIVSFRCANNKTIKEQKVCKQQNNKRIIGVQTTKYVYCIFRCANNTTTKQQKVCKQHNNKTTKGVQTTQPNNKRCANNKTIKEQNNQSICNNNK